MHLREERHFNGGGHINASGGKYFKDIYERLKILRKNRK